MNHILSETLYLIDAWKRGADSDDYASEIAALRQVIEQAEKQKQWTPDDMAHRPGGLSMEPVPCQHKRYSVDVHEQTGTCYDCGAQGRMRFVVYETTPPKREWVGLTDEEIYAVIRPLCNDDTAARMLVESSMDEYRAIEAKLKEKNT